METMKLRFAVCGALLVGALVACNKKQDEPKPDPVVKEKPDPAAMKPKEPPPDPAQRGSYVAEAGGCLTCHTGMANGGPDLANAGAGGLEIPDPAGTWRSPNITPDKASGIGNWTDDQIIRAVREGQRPDGQLLYAIMPYQNYNRMTDDDAKALVAFLRTLKPVERVVAPNKDLKFPKIPVGKPANQPDVTTDPVKHGEYLATMMLCSHCHWTPDAKMAPAGPDKMFSGGLDMTIAMFGPGKLYAPNITSDPDTGIGKWKEDEIFAVIRTMVKPNSKMISPPMLLLQAGWSQMDEKDLHAVAAYIHQLPPVKNKVPDSTFQFKPPGAPPAAGSGAEPKKPKKMSAPKKG
jgi:cytochrome c553